MIVLINVETGERIVLDGYFEEQDADTLLREFEELRVDNDASNGQLWIDMDF